MKTKNYEQFERLDWNRNLNRNHINEIKDSIAKYGYSDGCPILVTKDFEIVDGQHRYVACKEMGLPIIYAYVDDSDDLIATLNSTQKKWTLEDYVNYWAKKEHNQDYLRLQNLCKELGISTSMALTIAKKNFLGGSISKQVHQGSLKFTTEDSLKVRAFYLQVQRFCKISRLRLTTRLCQALIILSKKDKFKWDTLISKTTSHRTLAYNCHTREEFLVMLKDLYNYSTRKVENRI